MYVVPHSNQAGPSPDPGETTEDPSLTDLASTAGAQSPPGPTFEELSWFFSNSIDLFCIANFEGYFVHLNPHWEQALGHSLAELRSRPFVDFVHPDDRQATLAEAARLAGGAHTATFENRYQRKDGEYLWFRWSCQGDPKAGLLYAAAFDITQMKHAAERLELAIESSPTGMMVLDEEDRIVLANKQIETLFGYRSEELLGETADGLLRMPDSSPPPRCADQGGGLLRAVATGSQGGEQSFCGLRKDGAEIPVEIGIRPMNSAKGTFWVISIADISPRQRRDLELSAQIGELQKNRIELGLLGEMSSMLQHALDAEESYEIAGAYATRLFGKTPGGIYIVPPGGRMAALASCWSGFQGAGSFEVPQCWAMRRAQIHPVRGTDRPVCPHTREAAGFRHRCIPMSAHGQLLGVITLQTPQQEAEPDGTTGFGVALADQLALALSNLQLRNALHDLSVRDSLTGLYNRRYLEESIRRELPRAIRRGAPLSVLMLDVDHFKRVNDERGHKAADDILRRVCEHLASSIRREDIVCRYGGEEIVVLLPDCAEPDAVKVADKLRVQAYEVSARQVTVSIGVAVYPQHGSTWALLLEAADRAMYAAKQQGRDRVVLAKQANPWP